MNRNLKRKVTILFSIAVTMIFSLFSIAYGAQYPEDFSDLLLDTEQKIHVVLNDDLNGQYIMALVNYEHLKIEQNSHNGTLLRTFLQGKGVKTALTNKIFKDTVEGITTDSACYGILKNCSLTSDNTDVQYIFDFDNLLLKIIINPNELHDDLEHNKQTIEIVQDRLVFNDNDNIMMLISMLSIVLLLIQIIYYHFKSRSHR